MQKLKVKVPWQYGLHVRSASYFCNLVRETDSSVMIGKGEQMVKGTRIIDVIELGVQKGDYITIEIEGSDEEEVAEKIKQFFMVKKR